MVFPFVCAKYKSNFLRNRCKLSFPLPLGASPLALAFSWYFLVGRGTISIKVVLAVKHDAWSMFHSLQCAMVNPSVTGSLVLFTFIIIKETIQKNCWKELITWEGVKFQLKWLWKFLSMRELKNFIFKISQMYSYTGNQFSLETFPALRFDF